MNDNGMGGEHDLMNIGLWLSFGVSDEIGI